jgi:polysaccharide export outer membrane protein
MGQVKKAGGFQITSHDSISLLRALALAEGLDHDASPKKARIMRASALGTSSVNEMPVDLQQILAGKAPDVELHADDVLFVPSNTAQSATRRAAEAAIQIATGVAIYRH